VLLQSNGHVAPRGAVALAVMGMVKGMLLVAAVRVFETGMFSKQGSL